MINEGCVQVHCSLPTSSLRDLRSDSERAPLTIRMHNESMIGGYWIIGLDGWQGSERGQQSVIVKMYAPKGMILIPMPHPSACPNE